MQRGHWVWLIVVIAGALAFSVWGLTYFTQLGHPLWALLVYAFFVVLFIYGRPNRVCSKKPRNKSHKPNSPQA